MAKRYHPYFAWFCALVLSQQPFGGWGVRRSDDTDEASMTNQMQSNDTSGPPTGFKQRYRPQGAGPAPAMTLEQVDKGLAQAAQEARQRERRQQRAAQEAPATGPVWDNSPQMLGRAGGGQIGQAPLRADQVRKKAGHAGKTKPNAGNKLSDTDKQLAMEILYPELKEKRLKEERKIRVEQSAKIHAANQLRRDMKCWAPFEGYETNRTEVAKCEGLKKSCVDSYQKGALYGGWWCDALTEIYDEKDRSGKFKKADGAFNCEYYYFWYSNDGSVYQGTNPELFFHTTGMKRVTTVRCSKCYKREECSK
eukprot:TRINITY_DN9443_c0_g1_i2.p1 TRINITY_DN9443_c0_g1~~TRINITY_DN9443_c0_g1_i2.p1  ORF type:complete len:345 (-),score=29.12 TRINITY_DN9443_c0_g1_i2:256-1179(-)